MNRNFNCYSSGRIYWFLTCYFNDIVGAIAFSSYCDVITFNAKNVKHRIDTLWKMEIVLFISGLFWEYITPIFRKDTVGDAFDILAYCLGGVIFWIISKKFNK